MRMDRDQDRTGHQAWHGRGHLPGDRRTEEISKIRNKPMGRGRHSASSRFLGVDFKEDLKALLGDYVMNPTDDL